jgi:hypothetical protein
VRQGLANLTSSTFWSAPVQPKGRWVELGALRLPRDEIVGCRVEDVVERDGASRLATLALLLAAVLVLVLGLIDLGWQVKAMLGASAVAIIGLVVGLEGLGITRTVYYRLDVLLRDGRRVGYTTASRADAEALAGDLGELGSEQH